MIDSIQSVSIQHFDTLISDSTDRTKKEKSTSRTDSFVSTTKSQPNQDSVSLNFNLYGDIQSLRDSVRVVYDQIQQQIEDYYGNLGTSADTDLLDSMPSTDATPQQWMEYIRPENTSQRILNFATGFLSAYQANHTDSSEEENIDEFTAMMTDAIQEGFDQAEQILGDFENLGSIGESIKKTYDLVMKGLEDYRLTYLNDLGMDPNEPDTPIEEKVDENINAPDEINLLG